MFCGLVILTATTTRAIRTLGEGDKAYGEYYESSTNTERELYFDLYCTTE